MFESNFEIGGY